MITKDAEFTVSRMNGQLYSAGKYAKSLRMQLWREHLGLLSEQIELVENLRKLDDVIPDESMHTSNIIQQMQAQRKIALQKLGHVFDKPKALLKAQRLLFELDDPVSDYTYHRIWRDFATKNSQTYEAVFDAVPRSDKYFTADEYMAALRKRESIQESMDLRERKRWYAEQRKILHDSIHGHVCMYPMDWLKNDTFRKSSTTAFVPDEVFQ